MVNILAQLEIALRFRQENLGEFFQAAHESAFRVFNGFTEGCPDFSVEIFGTTLVIYPVNAEANRQDILDIHDFYYKALPWLQTTIIKPRTRNGKSYILHGSSPVKHVKENGIWYAVDLLLHQDSTLYLDTRILRNWITRNLVQKTVLNTFAYTGSLGAAAKASGAAAVIQTDLDNSFLQVAKRTYKLNSIPVTETEFQSGDFFSVTARLKSQQLRFDCVILDPPFFSKTDHGGFNLNSDFSRLVNKVRPLIAHLGYLIAVQNAVYVSGQAFMNELNSICASGYAQVADIIPVSPDFTGSVKPDFDYFPANPAPFNHPTKIAILRFERKDQLQANMPKLPVFPAK